VCDGPRCDFLQADNQLASALPEGDDGPASRNEKCSYDCWGSDGLVESDPCYQLSRDVEEENINPQQLPELPTRKVNDQPVECQYRSSSCD